MNINEETEAVAVSPDVLYQQDKAAADIQVLTAHQFPRNITRSVEDAIAIVTLDEEIAKTCSYSVPRAGKAIVGPSVHLAKILAQTWGNMRVQAKVVGIDAKQITSQAVAWDLQSNLAIQVEVKRSIVSKTTGRYDDSLISVTGNAANSIALRNAILAVIPRGVVDKVYNAAKKKMTGDISDKDKFIARKNQVVNALKDAYGVTEPEILSSIGRASLNHITEDDIIVLIGIGTAIRDGDTTVDMAFKNKKMPTTPIKKDDKEKERVDLMVKDITNCGTLEDLEKYKKTIGKDPELKKAYDQHKATLEALSK